MEIAGLTAAQHADYLALVNAEIRPPGAATQAWDDFPLALDRSNLPWMLGASGSDGRLAGGLAILVRPFATSCGAIAVGAVGSVVTRPDQRGQGLSTRLQAAALALLRRQEVPLAALWTDRPEIYAGRGFIPAGWEWHVGLGDARLPEAPPDGVTLREWRPEDLPAAVRLYDAHLWRTLRRPGDAARLYGMPGTRGLVAEAGGEVRAAVFCGKGADFPDYVTEWSGEPELVLCLLGLARARALAGAVLIPAGGEALADRLAAAGSTAVAMASGCWAVVRPDLLASQLTAAGVSPPPPEADARAWLGDVADDGSVAPGPLSLAVWGFDSA
jgi:GNAT superfamily N-acetyltransferase